MCTWLACAHTACDACVFCVRTGAVHSRSRLVCVCVRVSVSVCARACACGSKMRGARSIHKRLRRVRAGRLGGVRRTRTRARAGEALLGARRLNTDHASDPATRSLGGQLTARDGDGWQNMPQGPKRAPWSFAALPSDSSRCRGASSPAGEAERARPPPATRAGTAGGGRRTASTTCGGAGSHLDGRVRAAAASALRRR